MSEDVSTQKSSVSAAWVTNILLAIAAFFLIQQMDQTRENAKELAQVKMEVIKVQTILERTLKDNERLERRLEDLEDEPTPNRRRDSVSHANNQATKKEDTDLNLAST